MSKVSIIVPVYNTEEYLDKCLKSLVNQTIDNFEIIVVNDGSPDNSEDIIKKFQNKYPEKIKYYLKPNGGLSDARNFGMNKATGEYVGFVDSDDYIQNNMFELLLKKAEENNFDMVVSDVNIVYPDNRKKIVFSSVKNNLFNRENVKSVMPVIYPIVCNKIFKKKIIQNIQFTKGVWFEDIDFLYRVFSNIESIGVCRIPLYNYMQRENSITYTYNEKLYDFIHNMDNIVKYYKQNNLYDEYQEELEYLYVRYAFATFMKRLAKAKDKKIYKEGYNYAVRKVNEKFPNYKNNKYLKQNGLKGYYIKYFNRILAKLNYIINKNKKYN